MYNIRILYLLYNIPTHIIIFCPQNIYHIRHSFFPLLLLWQHRAQGTRQHRARSTRQHGAHSTRQHGAQGAQKTRLSPHVSFSVYRYIRFLFSAAVGTKPSL